LGGLRYADNETGLVGWYRVDYRGAADEQR
jgi:hypothetical protein